MWLWIKNPTTATANDQANIQMKAEDNASLGLFFYFRRLNYCCLLRYNLSTFSVVDFIDFKTRQHISIYLAISPLYHLYHWQSLM